MGQKNNSQCSSPACIHFSYAGDIATTYAVARFTQTLADLGVTSFLLRAQAVSFWVQPVAQPAAPHNLPLALNQFVRFSTGLVCAVSCKKALCLGRHTFTSPLTGSCNRHHRWSLSDYSSLLHDFLCEVRDAY